MIIKAANFTKSEAVTMADEIGPSKSVTNSSIAGSMPFSTTTNSGANSSKIGSKKGTALSKASTAGIRLRKAATDESDDMNVMGIVQNRHKAQVMANDESIPSCKSLCDRLILGQ